MEDNPDNPNNFYGIAGVPVDLYTEIAGGSPWVADYSEQINEFCYVNIHELKKHSSCSEDIIDLLARWDMGNEFNSHISSSYFMTCTLPRIRAWAESLETREAPVILDSMWLQIPINEMLFRNGDEASIEAYCSSIAEAFRGFNKVCIYLKHQIIRDGLAFASQVKGESWIARVAASICKTPYGVSHDLQGVDGVIDFFTRRAEIEKRILALNSMAHYEYFVDDHNWSKLHACINNDLQQILHRV